MLNAYVCYDTEIQVVLLLEQNCNWYTVHCAMPNKHLSLFCCSWKVLFNYILCDQGPRSIQVKKAYKINEGYTKKKIRRQATSLQNTRDTRVTIAFEVLKLHK